MARLKGSGIKFDLEKLEAIAAEGTPIREMAALLGTNINTFKRVKRNNPDVKAAYDRGVQIYADNSGARRALSNVEKSEVIIRHLIENPAQNSFRAIQNATLLTSDEISSAMVELILTKGVVSSKRGGDGNFRYFISPRGRDIETSPNGIRFNERQSTSIFNKETQWQSAY